MRGQDNKREDNKREYTVSITILAQDYEEVIKKSSKFKNLYFDYKVEEDIAIVSLKCNSRKVVNELKELLKDLIIN